VIVCELHKVSANERLGGEWPEYWKLYCDKNGGHRLFQIALWIALLNYGIGLHWDANLNTRQPCLMTQSDFVPCDCEKSFFCKHCLTTGNAHKKNKRVVIEYACGSWHRTNKCTTEQVLLKKKNGDDMKNSTYYRMCYRKQDGDDATTEVKKSHCNNSKFGCAQCKEPICVTCWPKYDKHKSKINCIFLWCMYFMLITI